jgi:hypothetical protein
MFGMSRLKAKISRRSEAKGGAMVGMDPAVDVKLLTTLN